MATLLALPREIRDRILYFAVTSRRQAPTDHHSDAAMRPRQHAMDIPYRSWMDHKGVLYETATPEPVASGLLGASRQLRDETMALFKRHGSTFVLDVMFVEERELWPTWLYIPRATKRMDIVDATFRIMGTMTRKGGGYSSTRSVWQGGDGAGPALMWIFYGLLERFLHAGPVGPRPQPEDPDEDSQDHIKDRNITVRKLILRFESHGDASLLAAPEDRADWYQCRNGFGRRGNPELRGKVMRPEWLATYVAGELEHLLGVSYHTFGVGNILYYHIGEIQILVDNKEIKHYKLDQWLATVKCDPLEGFTRDERFERFKKWKPEAMKIREEAGLPVLPIVNEC